MNYAVKNIYGKIKTERCTVEVPGSKSITARALLIAALAEGESILSGVQYSDDCKTFLQCVNDLGIETKLSDSNLKVLGCGGKLINKRGEIYVGSAGTAARFITAFLAFVRGEYVVKCSPQMLRRPIAPLVSALKSAGAKFTFLGEENCFPFIIEGTENPAPEIKVDVEKSSQFLSALLIAATCAKKPVKIVPYGVHGMDYVNITLNMMRSFGADIKVENGEYTVSGKFAARNYEIEPDVSAASYFYAAGKILNADISVKGVTENSMQGDIKFISLLQNFNGGKIDMSAFSDQALTLAAIAPYFKTPTEIVGVKHIRGQECDRIAAIVKNLTAMGVEVEEREDGVKIYPSAPKPCKVQTFGDHRVAMAFSVTGLRADGIEIKNAEVCSKTFKNYFDTLDGLIKKLIN